MVISMTVSLSGLAATLPVEATNTMELGGGDDPAPAAFCAQAAPCAAMPTATLAAITHTVMASPWLKIMILLGAGNVHAYGKARGRDGDQEGRSSRVKRRALHLKSDRGPLRNGTCRVKPHGFGGLSGFHMRV
jgi:hypothetical protein